MEIIKHKKEVMQVVKYTFVILLFLFSSSCIAQNISGKYAQKYPVYGASGVGISYSFTQSSFTQITYEHLGIKTLAKGSYQVVGDTLILKYESLRDPAPSYWKFVQKDSLYSLMGDDSFLLSDGIKVQFRSVNRTGEPRGGANLAVRNKKEEVVTGFVSDSLGYFPKMFFYGDYIQNFKFTFVGRKPVTIKADTLRGHKSKINVILSNSQTYYSDYEGVKKYLIKNSEEDKITLQSLKSNKEIILEKEK